MTTKITLIALTSALALGFAACGQSASAQTADGVTVSYADLNISTAAGAKVLLQRIHAAAADACGVAPTGPLDLQREHADCAKQVTDQTVANVNSPVLTAMNNGQSQEIPTDLASAR